MSIPMRIPEGRIVLTYEDYAAIPNDGKRYEILEGVLAVTPAPSTKHQTASVNLTGILRQHVRDKDLGKIFHAPADLILESTSVLQPDLVYISKARQGIITERAIEGTPDLVVEILSPTTTRNDRITKGQIYARHKVPAYWIVDPDQETLEVYLLDGDTYRLETTLQGETASPVPPFSELQLAAKDIFS